MNPKKWNSWALSVVAAGVQLIFTGLTGSARADDCPTHQPPQNHPMGNYDFQTNSYEERGINGYRVFHTCVFDAGTSDMQVIWYVPGMKGWVVAGGLWNYPRTREDVNPQHMDGCLRYSVDPPTYAGFSGTIPEERLAKTQIASQCSGLGGDATPDASHAMAETFPVQFVASQSADLASMSMPLSVFFPSDLSRPRETMLEFKGMASVKAETDRSYVSVVTYSVSRVDGRPDGDPSAVRLQPEFRGAAERLYSSFNRAYPEGFANLGKARDGGSAEGEFHFQVDSKTNWDFAPAVFAFVDRDKRVLGEVEIPAFAPQASDK